MRKKPAKTTGRKANAKAAVPNSIGDSVRFSRRFLPYGGDRRLSRASQLSELEVNERRGVQRRQQHDDEDGIPEHEHRGPRGQLVGAERQPVDDRGRELVREMPDYRRSQNQNAR